LKIVIEGDIINDKVFSFINENIGLSLGEQAKFFTSEILDSIHFGVNESYETDISFKDRKTAQSTIAKSRSGFEIKPFTYINESLIERNLTTNIPSKESIKEAIKLHFMKVKNEI
ncbi:MAG: hypothetical protein AB8B69_15430, partial [Chitinophagales bacterium]